MLSVLWMLIETAGSLLVTACILRAYAQWVRVHPRNPLIQFLVAITDWLVRPMRRVLPSHRGIDVASIVAALSLALLLAGLRALLFAEPLTAMGRAPHVGSVALLACVWTLRWSLYALMGLLMLQVVLSWVNPDAPMAPAVDQLVRPFLAPVRRIVPLVGSFDLSPLVVFVLIQAALMLLEPLARTLP